MKFRLRSFFVFAVIVIIVFMITRKTHNLPFFVNESFIDTIPCNETETRYVFNGDTIMTFSDYYYYYDIPVIIDNKLIQSVFDTGAGTCVFNLDTITNNAGEEVYKYFIDFFGNKTKYDRMYKSTIQIGTRHINQDSIILSKHFGFSIIGGTLLKHYVWKIDNVKHKIYFTQKASNFVHEGISVPIEICNNVPFIKCAVNGKTYKFELDTGASSFFANIAGDTEFANEGNIFRWRNEKYSKDICYTIGDLQIDSLLFSDEIIHYGFSRSNLLGLDFFKRFEYVIIDYKNQMLHLGPVSKHKSLSYMCNLQKYINTIGITCSGLPPYSYISGITVDTAGFETGLDIGDIIESVDGNYEYDMHSIQEMMYGKDSVLITVKNQNVHKTALLRRKKNIPIPDTVSSFSEILLYPMFKNMDILRIDDGYIVKYFGWGQPFYWNDKNINASVIIHENYKNPFADSLKIYDRFQRLEYINQRWSIDSMKIKADSLRHAIDSLRKINQQNRHVLDSLLKIKQQKGIE